MWIYDEFVGLWYYDELDTSPGTSYVQTGNCIVALSANGGQEWAGDYSQDVDVLLGIYSYSTQELLLPGTAQAYTQFGAVVVSFFGNGTQEHIPVGAGQSGQSGNVTLYLTAGGFQAYRGGGNPGDVVQTADIVVLLTGASSHSYVLPEFVSLVAEAVASVAPYGSESVAPITFAFGTAPPSISRVTITFESADPIFAEPVGPAGGELYVEVSLLDPDRVPLVSLSAAKPIAEFFQGQAGDAFQRLSDAVESGSLMAELRSYEALPSRVVPQLLGASTLTIEALP